MNPLAFLQTGINSLIVILIASLISLTGGAYLGYNYEKNYFEAKINKDNIERQKAYEKDREQRQAQYDLAIAQLFKNLQAEQAKNSGYLAQAKALHLAYGSGNDSANCRVSYGFIRLFNASATGQTTVPASSDSATSPIDIDTVLAAIIDNNGKYRQAANQIDAIRAAE